MHRQTDRAGADPRLAASVRARAVVVAGPPASGKTTLGAALARVLHHTFIDLDIVTGAMTRAALALAGADETALDGALGTRLRDARYDALLDTAAANLDLGLGVVVSGPFTRERLDPARWEAIRRRLGCTDAALICLELDEPSRRTRMEARGAPRDRAKLRLPDLLEPRRDAGPAPGRDRTGWRRRPRGGAQGRAGGARRPLTSMLIVNPNFTVDRTIPLGELVPGDVIRTGRAAVTLGGKGINVARVGRAFGDRAPVLGFLPKQSRATLDSLAAAEGVELSGVEVAGALRGAAILIESGGRVTVLNEPGPEVGESDWAALLELIEREAGGHETVVCAGSLPPGSPVDGYARVVAAAHRAGARAVVDASGAVLRATLAAGPDVVSPNLAEAASLISGRLVEGVEPAGPDVPERAERAAQDLLDRGARHAIVSAGSRGAAAASAEDARERGVPPRADACTSSTRSGPATRSSAGSSTHWKTGAIRRSAAGFALATASASCEQELAGGVDPARVRELDRGGARCLRRRRCATSPAPPRSRSRPSRA